MYLNCPRCRTNSAPGALFCQSCGTAFAVKQTLRNSIVLPLIIAGALLAVCGFCGLLGLVGSRNKTETAQTANVNAKSLVGATLPDQKTVANSVLVNTPLPDNGEERMATVIKDNADLRQTNSARGEIIETLPKDSIIEVVKQSGAWFYVRAVGGQSGWLHGNAIRLKGNGLTDATTAPKPVDNAYSESRSTRPAAPEPRINNSGATAKCRDGSLSYSAHRRGTCSHHGGVSVWY